MSLEKIFCKSSYIILASTKNKDNDKGTILQLFYTSLMMNILKKNKPSTVSFTSGLLTRFKTKCDEHPSSMRSESTTQSSFLALHSLSESILFMRFPFFLYIFHEFMTNPLSMQCGLWYMYVVSYTLMACHSFS